MRKILDLITKAIILSPLVSFCYGDNNVVFEMRSQCHEPLASDCTDTQTCCINATDYYVNFFKKIQGVNESVILPYITDGLFPSLLDFTKVNNVTLFDQEDQDNLSKSCLENEKLPLPYELPDLVEISYAYLFHVCEKGFEFAESLVPITGVSETTIDVASIKTKDEVSRDMLPSISSYVEGKLPEMLGLNEAEYEIIVELNESGKCENIVTKRLVPLDETNKINSSYEKFNCTIGISYTITIIQTLDYLYTTNSYSYINKKVTFHEKALNSINNLLGNKTEIGEILWNCCGIIILVNQERDVPTSVIFISASAGLLVIGAFLARQSNKPVAAESSRRIEIIFPVPSLPEVQENIQKEEEILLPTGNA
ncbi:predicted protein [Chaetoceros tenuissimus]|uniref:Uncharacterized protein n=1 Tax=Chaetoceros tenuissimus TaxID=426638 RepID=A0AAD3H6Y7_9STRA|nr:predicted protein [Chaetoceros tenuissimus]